MKNRIVNLLLLSFVFISSAYGRDVKSFNDGWSFRKGNSGKFESVKIPHTWNAQDMQTHIANLTGLRNPQDRFYTGEASYKKNYTPDISLKGKRVFLKFEGIGSVASIYVNDKFAGNHKGAYSAFVVEIGKLLNYGEENEIVVKADNSARPDVIPVNHILFGVYGGMYRDVSLITTEKINIAITDFASSGIYISQENVSDKSADVRVKIKMENVTGTPQQIKLVTTIYEMGTNKVKAAQESPITLTPQGRQFFEHRINIKKPHLWQGLEDPYLYRTVVQVVSGSTVIDEVVQPLGVRHFELKVGEGMLLNGEKVPMYGVCRHQDWWEKGSALTEEEHRTDLEIIKEIGATTIRFAHYQQAEYIYAKCDSIGFIVWAEIPFVNQVTTQEADNAKQQLVELIRQNYNHPCIYTWGLHNEVYNPNEFVVALTSQLDDLAKSEDPYRYTVSVSGYNEIDRPANNYADIQGVNQYFGWYNGNIQDIYKWVEKVENNFPNHKVIFSEYGGEANINQQIETIGDRGFCCGYDKKYYEAFATKFHEIHWGALSKSKYILASYIWNTFDFATPLSSQGGVHSRNMKGLVTFDRKTKKDPFFWYKANWSKEPVLYITQRRVVNRGNEFTPVTIYSNRGIPKLFVNGKEITNYSAGTTAVHYIFNLVQLNKGENIVEAKVMDNGKEIIDRIVWTYSPEFKDGDNTNTPALRTKEHIGL